MRRFADHRVYYTVTEGSAADKAIDALEAQYRKRGLAIRAAFKKLKLPKEMHAFGSDTWIGGFTSDPSEKAFKYVQAHSNTWRWETKRHCYAAPRRNTPEGRAIAKLFDEIPEGISGEAMNHAFAGTGAFFTGMALVYCGYIARKGKPRIVSMPASIIAASKQPDAAFKKTHMNRKPVIVDGLVEMKQSEALEAIGALDPQPVEA